MRSIREKILSYERSEMVQYYFKTGQIRALLICLSYIILFMLLSGHWTFTKSTTKHKEKDSSTDLTVEFSNISVLKEAMLKG